MLTNAGDYARDFARGRKLFRAGVVRSGESQGDSVRVERRAGTALEVKQGQIDSFLSQIPNKYATSKMWHLWEIDLPSNRLQCGGLAWREASSPCTLWRSSAACTSSGIRVRSRDSSWSAQCSMYAACRSMSRICRSLLLMSSGSSPISPARGDVDETAPHAATAALGGGVTPSGRGESCGARCGGWRAERADFARGGRLYPGSTSFSANMLDLGRGAGRAATLRFWGCCRRAAAAAARFVIAFASRDARPAEANPAMRASAEFGSPLLLPLPNVDDDSCRDGIPCPAEWDPASAGFAALQRRCAAGGSLNSDALVRWLVSGVCE